MTRTIEQAREIAAECRIRVKQRQDYASDNEHAAAYRRSEELELVRRIVAARKRRRK